MYRSLFKTSICLFSLFSFLLLYAPLQAQCNFGGTFDFDTQVRVPNTGIEYRIRIRARGADGGNYGKTTGRGGSGAIMEAEFTVYPNDELEIYIGDAGRMVVPDLSARAGGGGGGTAVVINQNIVLIAAGGGGGSGGSVVSPHHGRGGRASVSSVPAGGTTLSGGGAGGGGFGVQSAGESGYIGGVGGGAATLQHGGDGGPGESGAADGGYGFGGGGGGGGQAGGGGGGFRGGNGGVSSAVTYAGGSSGNSFVTGAYSATVLSAIAGVDGAGQQRNGEVVIECLSVLPVEFTAFTARQVDKDVQLDWTTAVETDNEGFAVEHSADGIVWNRIGFVPGKGNTTKSSSYQFLHAAAPAALNYYRLKQLDLDGDFEYSHIISLIINQSGKFDIFPNPTTGTVQLTGLDVHGAVLEATDNRGKVVKRIHLSGQRVDLSDLPAGIYFLKITTARQSFSRRLIRH